MNDEELWDCVKRACNLHPNAPISEQLLAQFRYVTECAIRFRETNSIEISWCGLTDRQKIILIRNEPNWTALQLIEETETTLKENNA
jgi:hypothetical protein